ncbi:MAG: NADH-quinone oxidoreductase subunit A [archaeon]|nr:NADH-quinone oxidoreductase subunit A [archaeon]MCP8320362.1 NADH-quinone oxidoreductase subunit A [archaeon]
MSKGYFDLLALTLYFLLSVLTPIALYGMGLTFGERKPSKEKNMSFECGQVPVGKAHMRVTIHYYPYALIYGVFAAFAILMLISAPGLAVLELETIQFGLIGLPLIATIVLAMVLMVAATALRRARLWRS